MLVCQVNQNTCAFYLNNRINNNSEVANRKPRTISLEKKKPFENSRREDLKVAVQLILSKLSLSFEK